MKSNRKIRAARKKRKISCTDQFSDFVRLAEDMRIELPCPFLTVEGLNNIGYDRSTRELILGTDLLHRLNLEEQSAAVAHEFAHAAKWHCIPLWHFVRLGLLAVISVVLFVTLPALTVPGKTTVVFPLMSLSVAFMIFTIVSHWNEYAADRVAAERKGSHVAIAALQKMKHPDSWDVEYVTHPSVNRRIAKLRRHCPS